MMFCGGPTWHHKLPSMLQRWGRPLSWRGCAAVFLGCVVAFGAAAAATPAPGNPLDGYLDGLTSLRTSFNQTVTDAHGNVVEAGEGTLIVQRPGKFRWDYVPRAADGAVKGAADGAATGAAAAVGRGQLLVADGKNLWFYDRELSQVTVKPVEAALSTTPIILLSGSGAQLHESFDISSAGAHDGLEWVTVQPRSSEADFSHAQLGFAHGQLARMLVNDRLGQTVRLDFSHAERNVHIDPAQLQFKPPDGADVIGTPQS